MRFEIRTAALAEDVWQRVGRAVARLRVFHLHAKMADWDGTRCDLLVAAVDDAYGFKVAQLALSRNMPVVAIGAALEPLPVASVSANVEVAELAELLRARLPVRQGGEAGSQRRDAPGPAPAPTVRCSAPVCRLAIAPLRGQAVNVHRDGRTLMLRPRTGRVHAASHSDLIGGRDAFMDPRWGMAIAEAADPVPDAASAPLESFLLRVAFRGRNELPDFPAGKYHLNAWPDLGAVPSLLSALHIAKELVRGAVSPEDLYASTHRGTDRASVNACLWALAAADLLIAVKAEAPAESEWSQVTIRREDRRRSLGRGVWTRLATRFGLLSAGDGES